MKSAARDGDSEGPDEAATESAGRSDAARPWTGWKAGNGMGAAAGLLMLATLGLRSDRKRSDTSGIRTRSSCGGVSTYRTH
jgi:hypothetical protein